MACCGTCQDDTSSTLSLAACSLSKQRTAVLRAGQTSPGELPVLYKVNVAHSPEHANWSIAYPPHSYLRVQTENTLLRGTARCSGFSPRSSKSCLSRV